MPEDFVGEGVRAPRRRGVVRVVFEIGLDGADGNGRCQPEPMRGECFWAWLLSVAVARRSVFGDLFILFGVDGGSIVWAVRSIGRGRSVNGLDGVV